MRDIEFERVLGPSEAFNGSFEGEYGSYRLASRYCGFRRTVRQCPGLWQHGWAPDHFNLELEMVVGTDGRAGEARERCRFFVARSDQSNFLRLCGVKHVEAIGLPIVYAPPPKLGRIPNSLLVVPVHSGTSTKHDWNFEEYAESVFGISKSFSRVLVCVHGSCLEKRYWIDAFERRGLPWIVGASYSDANTLNRMRNLFSSFEYTTTNGFGSHLAYAAAFGSKVSIWGPFSEYRMSDMEGDVLARNAPDSMRLTIEFSSQSFLRGRYPELFTAPRDAPLRVEWGRSELGWDNRKSPEELKKIFGWDLKTRVMRAVTGRLRRVLGFSGG